MKTGLRTFDLKMLKYRQYIRKHPEKAYGYYCLGRLHLIAGDYSRSEEYFRKAVEHDPACTRAKLGQMELFLLRGKILKAIAVYRRNEAEINGKKLYRSMAAKVLSSLYGNRDAFPGPSGILSPILRPFETGAVKRTLRKQPGNLAAKLIFCMHLLYKSDISRRARDLYRECVRLEGVSNAMRWAILKQLSEVDGHLDRDAEILRKFTGLPGNGCPPEYTNLIFENALTEGHAHRITAFMDSLGENTGMLTPGNIWKYLDFCRQTDRFDASVANLSRKLLAAGWVDRLVAGNVIRAREQYPPGQDMYESRVLALFGYKDI